MKSLYLSYCRWKALLGVMNNIMKSITDNRRGNKVQQKSKYNVPLKYFRR